MADNKTPIAKAYVQVLPTTKGIKGALSASFGAEGSSAGSIFGSQLIDTVKGVMMAAGLGEILKESLFAGADLQQSLGGVETLFKDSADIVIANAEQAYKTAGMSANQYMETVTGFSASLLQGLSGDTKAAAEVADMALKDMSDNANKMGTDMELIQNAYQGFAKQNYTMLDNLKLGYGGTKTEMQRLLADAQKLTGVKYDISNLADVYEAIHVIQEEMGITGTTALEASTTFSGSLASMKAAASDVMANLTLGRDIGPSLDALGETVLSFIGGNLLPMVGNLMSGLPEVIRGAFSAAVSGLNIAADNAPQIIAQGAALVQELAGAITENVPLLINAGWELAVAFGEEILAYDWLNSGVDLVLEFSGGLLDGAPDAIRSIGDILVDISETLLDAAPDVLARGAMLIGQLAEGLFRNAPEVFSAIGSVLGKLMAAIVARLPEILEHGADLIVTLITGIFTGIPLIIESAAELIFSFCESFADFDWLELGTNIIDGICQGIYKGFWRIWDIAGELAQNALDGVAFALDIHSPSGRFRDEIGVHIPSGIALGAKKNAHVLDDAMEELSELTLDAYHVDMNAALDAEEISLQKALSFDHRYTIGRNAPNSGNTVQVTIHVHAAEGMDIRALAREVARELAFEIEKAEVSVA